MMHMTFFSQISDDYRKDKNNLETEAKEFARELSNRIIDEFDVPKFIELVKTGIQNICDRHKSCKRLNLYEWSDYMVFNRVKRISIDGVFQISLYPINETPFPKP